MNYGAVPGHLQCRKRPPVFAQRLHRFGGWLTCELPQGHKGPCYCCFLFWDEAHVYGTPPKTQEAP